MTKKPYIEYNPDSNYFYPHRTPAIGGGVTTINELKAELSCRGCPKFRPRRTNQCAASIGTPDCKLTK